MKPAVVQRTAPAAASTRAPGWLWGTTVGARVLAASERAAYLLPGGVPAVGRSWTDGSSAGTATPGTPVAATPTAGTPTAGTPGAATETPDVLALVAPGALRLPGAVLVPGPGDLAALRLTVGAAVTVGGGRLHGPGAQLQVRRSWLPRPVPSGPWPAGRDLLVTLGSIPLRPGRDDLWSLAAEVLRDPVPGVPALVGLGPGLTPSGDDVLCGMLLVLRAAGHPVGRTLADAVRVSLHRTTALSATLLRDALDGYAVPPVRDLLAAAQRSGSADTKHGGAPEAGRPWSVGVAMTTPTLHTATEHRGTAIAELTELTELARAVTRIGHSSGSDLLVGVRTALDHLLATSVRAHPVLAAPAATIRVPTIPVPSIPVPSIPVPSIPVPSKPAPQRPRPPRGLT